MRSPQSNLFWNSRHQALSSCKCTHAYAKQWQITHITIRNCVIGSSRGIWLLCKRSIARFFSVAASAAVFSSFKTFLLVRWRVRTDFIKARSVRFGRKPYWEWSTVSLKPLYTAAVSISVSPHVLKTKMFSVEKSSQCRTRLGPLDPFSFFHKQSIWKQIQCTEKKTSI